MNRRTKITAIVIAIVAALALAIIPAAVLIPTLQNSRDAEIQSCYTTLTAGRGLDIDQLNEALRHCEEQR